MSAPILLNKKVILIGAGGVGKTSLTVRFTQGSFDPEYKETVGVSWAVKKVTINGDQVNLSIWDTAGKEIFDHIRPSYYKGAETVIIVFDVTRRETFDTLGKWFMDIENNCGNVPILLVANKVDMLRAVTPEDGMQLANRKGLNYIETSAATGTKVLDMFENIAREMLRLRKAEIHEQQMAIDPQLAIDPVISNIQVKQRRRKKRPTKLRFNFRFWKK